VTNKELADIAYKYAQAQYDSWSSNSTYDGIPNIRELYTEKLVELVMQERSKPLTYQQLKPIIKAHTTSDGFNVLGYTRAIEKSHGITGENN
jgi:hypothetical protein